MNLPLDQVFNRVFVVDVAYGYLRNFGTDEVPDWGATVLPNAKRFEGREAAEAALKAFGKPGAVKSLGEV